MINLKESSIPTTRYKGNPSSPSLKLGDWRLEADLVKVLLKRVLHSPLNLVSDKSLIARWLSDLVNARCTLCGGTIYLIRGKEDNNPQGSIVCSNFSSINSDSSIEYSLDLTFLRVLCCCGISARQPFPKEA